MSERAQQSGVWEDGELPANVVLGDGTRVCGLWCFKRFKSTHADGLVVGEHCTIDQAHLAVGVAGRLRIGHHCHISSAVLLAESDIRIGDRVMIGWHATIADADFHPLSPAERIADAIACAPGGKEDERPRAASAAVTIEDDVWIGPAVCILKGVTIGKGAWIEPGSIVTKDVPPGATVLGNPAREIERGSHD